MEGHLKLRYSPFRVEKRLIYIEMDRLHIFGKRSFRFKNYKAKNEQRNGHF